VTGAAVDVLSHLIENLPDDFDHVAYTFCEHWWSLTLRTGTTIKEIEKDTVKVHPLFGQLNLIEVNVSVIKVVGDLVQDGWYQFNHDCPDEPGVIDISYQISLDSDIDKILRNIRGTIAHEIYHAARRTIGGVEIGERNLDVLEHALNPEEIGARVEEVLAILTSDQDPSDPQIFSNVLREVITSYLARNGSSLSERDQNFLFHQMFETHMTEYRRIMRLFGGGPDDFPGHQKLQRVVQQGLSTLR